MTKAVDLNFELVTAMGQPAGLAGPIVSDQMEPYIKRMILEHGEESEIVIAMRKSQGDFSLEPYLSTLTDGEFNIVYNWLLNFSGFYDTERGQPFTMLKNAFNAAEF